MNLGQLLVETRGELDDPLQPGDAGQGSLIIPPGDDLEPDRDSLWKTSELTSFINQAVEEVAIRSRMLSDSTTDDICIITTVAGQHSYPLDFRILHIHRVLLEGDTSALLLHITVAMLDNSIFSWQSRTGTPTHYFLDLNAGSLALFPVPDSEVSIRMTVSRLPLADMVDELEEPEISPAYHHQLVDWACYRAFLKDESETLNPDKSAQRLMAFERIFGKRPTARSAHLNRTLPSSLAVQMRPFV